jgi:hypothetical protein
MMGRVYRSVLTHKGIEFEGFFYSSPEVNDLRIKAGSNLEVEIRVDESDIGSIYVLWPKINSTYRVPARNIEYRRFQEETAIPIAKAGSDERLRKGLHRFEDRIGRAS